MRSKEMRSLLLCVVRFGSWVLVVLKIVTILFLMLSIPACGDKQVNDSLSILCTGNESFGEFLNSAVYEYEKHSGIDVTLWEQISPYATNPSTEDDYKAYEERLKAAIMAGDGPDIFVFNGLEVREELYKMMDAGAFYDLNIFIKADSDFHMDNYEKIVMDAGIYADKRYLIPITYSVPHFIVSEEKLERFGVSIDDIGSYENLLDTALTLLSANKSFFTNINQIRATSRSVGWAGEVIDYENKKQNLDIDTFDRYMRFYKGEVDIRGKIGEGIYSTSYQELLEYEDGLLFSSETLRSTLRVLYQGTDYDGIMILPIPNYRGNATACVTHYAMISSSSVNRDNAWAFIKLLLGEDFQKNISTFDTSLGNGVGVYSRLIDYNVDNYLKTNNMFESIPQKYIDRIKNLYKNYDNAVVYGINGGMILQERYKNEYLASIDIGMIKEDLNQYYSIWLDE